MLALKWDRKSKRPIIIILVAALMMVGLWLSIFKTKEFQQSDSELSVTIDDLTNKGIPSPQMVNISGHTGEPRCQVILRLNT